MPEVARPHSPEELAQLSTFIHNLAGWLFLALAAALLYEALRGVSATRWRFAWPGLGMVIGFGLTAWVFFHQWLYHEVSPFADPVQNQHQVIGLCTGIGATVEVVRRRKTLDGKLWHSAWPLAIVGVGMAFLVHEQGNIEALILHWALGGTLVVAGLGLLAVALSGEAAKPLRILSTFILMTAALQLVFFDEKSGAHGDHGPAARPAASPPASSGHEGH